MSQRQHLKDRTRARVIEAARRLFAAQPYQAVTLRQIAAEAGLTTGAIFNGFKGKAEVWTAAMGTPVPGDRQVVRHADALEAALRALVAASRAGNPEAALRDAESLLERLEQTPFP